MSHSDNPDFREQDPMNTETDDKKSVVKKIYAWLYNHPLEVFGVLCIGASVGSYKLSQHLIASSIYKANRKTIDYLVNNIEIIKQPL